MAQLLPFVIYGLTCFLLAQFWASKKRIGFFWGLFFLLFFSLIIGIFVIRMSPRISEVTAPNDGYYKVDKIVAIAIVIIAFSAIHQIQKKDHLFYNPSENQKSLDLLSIVGISVGGVGGSYYMLTRKKRHIEFFKQRRTT